MLADETTRWDEKLLHRLSLLAITLSLSTPDSSSFLFHQSYLHTLSRGRVLATARTQNSRHQQENSNPSDKKKRGKATKDEGERRMALYQTICVIRDLRPAAAAFSHIKKHKCDSGMLCIRRPTRLLRVNTTHYSRHVFLLSSSSENKFHHPGIEVGVAQNRQKRKRTHLACRKRLEIRTHFL